MQGHGELATQVLWDPDGAGPLAEVLVLGGRFEVPSIGAQNLCWLDLTTNRFGAFDGQPNDRVTKLAVLGSGELVVAGTFSQIGNESVAGIAIGDGSSWQAPGGGFPIGTVEAMLVAPNGDLVIGGYFQLAGSASFMSLAKWDGSQWAGYPSITGRVSALSVRPNGNLIVGGDFPGNVAEWNGSWWTSMVPGLAESPGAVAVLDNGDVAVSGGVDRFVLWRSGSVLPIGSTIGTNPFYPTRILPRPNGEFLAGVVNGIGGVAFNGFARWDGGQWLQDAPKPAGMGFVRDLAVLPGGDLLAIGTTAGFTAPSVPVEAWAIGRWDGATWASVGDGFDGVVRGLQALPGGQLVAFGGFLVAGGTITGSVALWDGQAWSDLDVLRASCAAVDENDNLWLGGVEHLSAWSQYSNVAFWDGASWQTITGVSNVSAIVLTPGLRPIVGCSVYSSTTSVLQWDGSAWQPFGSGLDGPVHALLRHSSGDLIAGGEFLFSGATSVSRIARWDGSSWLPYGAGLDGPVRALAELPDGTLVAAGDFITDGTLLRPLNLVATWDGSDWQMLGQGLAGDPGVSVRDLHVLPNGDLLAGGDFLFAGGQPARGVARWDRAMWSPVDGGVNGSVFAIARMSDGEVVVGGNFSHAGNQVSAHLARARTATPAVADAYGLGCVASAGTLSLAASELPWLGASYRAACTPVVATSVGFSVYGLTVAQTPLATILPTGVPGCDLLAAPELVEWVLPGNGVLLAELWIPEDVALLGAQVHHQMLVAELGAQGSISLLAGSNALALTFGAL